MLWNFLSLHFRREENDSVDINEMDEENEAVLAETKPAEDEEQSNVISL